MGQHLTAKCSCEIGADDFRELFRCPVLAVSDSAEFGKFLNRKIDKRDGRSAARPDGFTRLDARQVVICPNDDPACCGHVTIVALVIENVAGLMRDSQGEIVVGNRWLASASGGEEDQAVANLLTHAIRGFRNLDRPQRLGWAPAAPSA